MDENQQPKQPLTPRKRGIISFILPYVIMALVIAFFVWMIIGRTSVDVLSVTQEGIEKFINDNSITAITTRITTSVTYITGTYLGTGGTEQYFEAIVENGYYNDTISGLLQSELTLETWIVENAFETNWFQTWGPTLLLLVGSVVIVLFLFSKMASSANASNRSAMDFNRSRARMVSTSKTRFSDVAGCEAEKAEMVEIVDYLKTPKKYSKFGAKIPKGVLLVGPPGTGKTLLAKAVAGEARVPFFSISGSDFVEMFVGVGASRVRDLFEQAKHNMPCIVFIDEIDAVGRQRGAGLGGGNDEREQTLNQLLVQMDGFETSDSIIVMAATNRADILDPALMRPGRFDRQVFVNVPDVKGREDIMKVHSRNKPLASDVNFKKIARLTAGFTGADIENMLNEAAILAARDDRKQINHHDITEAINKVIAGPAKKSRIITESDKRITAYHESGHAIVAKCLKNCETVYEVSIIPRGAAAGYTITLPDNDNNHMTKQQLLDQIAMLLGGRAAEEIVIKDVSTGASNDLQRASKVARKMVTEWGMSKSLGNMFLGTSEEVFLGRDYQTQLNYSDEVAAKIDEEIKFILDEQYKVALSTINAHRDVMEAMVRLLYEKETIYGEEIDKLFDDPATPQIELPENPEKTEDAVKAEDAEDTVKTKKKTDLNGNQAADKDEK